MAIPHNPGIERQILAAIVRKGPLFDAAAAYGITETAFHVPAHRRIFEAMAECAARGTAIDLVTLAERLPDLTIILAELQEHTIATDVNFPEWAAGLRRYEAARLIRAASLEVQEAMAEMPPDVAAAVARLAKAEELARRMVDGHRIKTLKETARELLENMVNAPPPVIPFFPPRTEGAAVWQLHPGEMMVIGARTGLGKTAFACGGVLEQLRAGMVVLYLCTESTGGDILARIAARHSGVSHFEAQKRNRNLLKVERFGRAAGEIATGFDQKLYLHGCENGPITPDTIRGRCREILVEAGRVDVVVIDFLQGVRAPAFLERRTKLEQTDYCIQKIHDVLKEFRAAGVVLAQFNRASQSDRFGNGRPDLTWLKDSSLIEQLAHTVTFLYRDDMKNPNAPTLFYSRKTRNQAPFTAGIELEWNGTGYESKPRYESDGISKAEPRGAGRDGN